MTRPKNTSNKFYFYFDPEKYWEYLETGKNPDELYPEHFKTDVVNIQYDEYMSKKLLPGEQYVLLDGMQHDYAITSFGRSFNCLYDTEIITFVGKTDATLILRDKKIKLSEFFKEQGWKWDINLVSKHIKKTR
jgi:hypothetical protein